MRSLTLNITVLALLALWLNEGESKALNEWNDKYYPNDFFDPYDDKQPTKGNKHGDRKRDSYDDVISGKGPFYRPGYNEVPAYQPMKPEKTRNVDNEIEGGYYWDNNNVGGKDKWDKMVKEKWEMPREGKGWEKDQWESSEDSDSEGSASYGFESDDEDEEDEMIFEEEMIEGDERRRERLEYELEDLEYDEEKLQRRLNRVTGRLADEVRNFNRNFGPQRFGRF